MKIYLAKPMSGYAANDVAAYFTSTQDRLTRAGYTVMHPMIGKAYLLGDNNLRATGYTQALSGDHAIIERDRWMVSNADIVLMDLAGAKVISIGCMFELAWAHDKGKHTVVTLEDSNPHKHAFVLQGADVVYPNLESALTYLEQLSRGWL
jgi:nucleoside 2-deoxyribosyltransferase